jgi:hypothetical protein
MVAVRRGHRRGQWWTSAALGAITVLGSGALTPTVPSPTIPGTTGPVDRAAVAMLPIYPSSSSGLLRLPETQSAPVGPMAAPGFPGPGPVVPGVPRDPRVPGPGPVAAGIGDRPVWRPARLEPVVGVDGRGHITSILEYTPGRFER